MPAHGRDFIAGSATIGTMLLVSGSAKLGYGIWALGMAALACIAYRPLRYVIGRAVAFLRVRAAGSLRRSQA